MIPNGVPAATLLSLPGSIQRLAKRASEADVWEAKYNALAAGVTDRTMVENAERIVQTAMSMASKPGCQVSVGDIVHFLLSAVAAQRPGSCPECARRAFDGLAREGNQHP